MIENLYGEARGTAANESANSSALSAVAQLALTFVVDSSRS